MKRRAAAFVVLALAACAAAAALASSNSGQGYEAIGGFASLRAAAASISHDCSLTGGSGLSAGTDIGLGLWFADRSAPLVYAAGSYGTNPQGTAGRVGAFSSRGLAILLGKGRSSYVFALWPCRPPVLFYATKKKSLVMKVLAGRRSGRATRALGGDTNSSRIDAHGRLVTLDGTTVDYSDGTTVALQGLPSGWRIDNVWPSPRSSRALVVEVERGVCPDIRLYLVRPGASPKRLAASSCNGPDLVAWSPDGSRILYSTWGPGSSTYVSDSTGHHARRLGANLNLRNALWSPDGRKIAYSYGGRAIRVAVIDVAAAGTSRVLTPFRWNPGEPPNQPPMARAVAWSPDGTSVAILYTVPNGAGTVVETVPARGGNPHILFRLPQ